MGAKFLRFFTFLSLFGMFFGLGSPAGAAPSERCFGVGQTYVVGGKIYTCTFNGSALVWNKGVPLSAKISKTTQPKVQGIAQVDQTLLAITGTWDKFATLHFQWLRNNKVIPGATDQAYVPGLEDVGSKISVRVTGSRHFFKSATETSKQTSPVKKASVVESEVLFEKDFANPLPPTIAQTPKVGSTLWAKRSNWASKGVTYKFQWLLDGQEITGAINPTYKVKRSDVGKQLAVTLTGSAKGYRKTTVISNTLVVQSDLKTLPAPENVQIKGSSVTNTYISIPSPWPSSIDVRYQWFRDGTAIKGATDKKYKLTNLDEAKHVSARIAAVEPGYQQDVYDSLSIGPVTKTHLLKFPDTGSIAVDGFLALGSTLSLTSSGWDPDAVLSVRWLRDGSVIEGQTGSTYEIQDADQDRTLSVVVTVQKAFYETLEKVQLVGKVVIKNFAKAPTPRISGVTRTGSTLSVSPDSLGWSAPAQLSYQWMRNGQALTGETSATYIISDIDLGAVISVTVTGKALGYHTVSRLSLASEPITSSSISGSQPIITGTAELDQTLSFSEGLWDAGTILSYQWFAEGEPIQGATNRTLKLTSSQVGKSITLQTTGSKPGYPDLVKTSNATSRVTQSEFTSAPVPTISGSPVVGQTLTAVIGLWSPSASLTYQWLKDGVPVPGAASTTFVVRQTDADSKLSVEVKASKLGYGLTARTSEQILVLTPPKIPTITSTFSKISSFDVSWMAESVADYSFDVLNSSGLSVGTYRCAASACGTSFTISGLPTNTTPTEYTLNYSATNAGGTVSGSTNVSTYPKQSLTVSVTSIVRTGDQYAFNFPTTPGWTYRFNNYGTYDNSNCGVMSGIFTTSPLIVYLPKGTCTMEFILTDGRGNTNTVIIPANITNFAAPAPELTGTLSQTSVTAGDFVDYTLTYSSYYPYYSYNLVILSGSTVITPSTPPTSVKVGDSWTGSKSGKISFSGFAPGVYTVRADFKSTSDVRYGYDQQASVILGEVTVN